MGFFVLLLFIFSSSLFAQQTSGMISGRVTDRQSGDPLPSCSIMPDPGDREVLTDSLGFFAIPLDFGEYSLAFNYTGYTTIYRKVVLNSKSPRVRLIIQMVPMAYPGDEIVVIGQAEDIAPDVQTIDRVDLQQMPNLYSDVIRSVKVLPGVTSNNELSSAYNVRGGNYDENLIYINGYQIYRPYLLRTGVEQNQSLVNPELTESMNFHSGGFPARFGDRMSSVLEVKYGRKPSQHFRGTARGDLFNFGLAFHHAIGQLSWSIGARYANPARFVNKLQTSGDYRPRYSDIQLLLNYRIPEGNRIELFLLYADNNFDLEPRQWRGNFMMSLYDVRGVDIKYSGHQQYNFQTGLLGLKWEKEYSPQSRLTLSLSGFLSGENEDRDLTGEIYYIPNSREPWRDRQYLKTRAEWADNRLELSSYDAKVELSAPKGQHHLRTGITLKSNQLKNRLDERIEEYGPSNILELEQIRYHHHTTDFHQFSWFGEDQFSPMNKIQLNFGLRYLHHAYTSENLLSPRVSMHYFPSQNHFLYARWGLYYQPPYYYELRSLTEDTANQIASQRAIHYILGWEHHIKSNLQLQAEIYYKKLNRLIPFYMEDLQLIYRGGNENEGYARGLDILIEGEIIEGLNSWISYSYLDTRERPISGGAYRRRLLDQTHTLRFFVQDKMPKFPFIQFHTRILYGSGYRFFPRQIVEDQETGEKYLRIDFNRTLNYPYYRRVDMGLSARINSGKRPEILIMAEVLNIFNHLNVLGYNWVQVFEDVQGAVAVPRVLTRRFLNVGIEVNF